jgi:tetratricopeptide (TPR) repeat protein
VQLVDWIREHRLGGSTRRHEHALHPSRPKADEPAAAKLHQRQPDWQRPRAFVDDPVEYHYKVALRLRGGNFPLAALNLAAWQSNELNQLVEAERNLIEGCANRTGADQTKNHNQHVRTQIECLISGCRLVLGDFSASQRGDGDGDGDGDDRRRRQPQPLPGGQTGNHVDASGEQTKAAAATTAGRTAGASTMGPTATSSGEHGNRASPIAGQSSIGAGPDEKCSNVSSWLQLAKAKVEQIDGGRTNARLRPSSAVIIASDDATTASLFTRAGAAAASGMDPFGDLNKQLASIYWLESRCARRAAPAKGASRLEPTEPIRVAYELALASSSPIEWDIYLDYADRLEGDDQAQIDAIERAARAEQLKRKGESRGAAEHVAASLAHLARRLAADASKLGLALGLVERALGLAPDHSDHLTLAGQLSYDLGRNTASETYYKHALDALLRDRPDDCGGDSRMSSIGRQSAATRESRRRLAAAHANYGAILQVNGRPGELALGHYRRALECDPSNSAAAENYKRIANLDSG